MNLTAADVQDAAGAEEIVRAVRKRWPWLKHLFADSTYDRSRLASLAAYKDFTLEVVRKLLDQKGFQVLPRRWAEPSKVPRAKHVERRRKGWNARSVGWRWRASWR